ncbi:hypothetical protein CDD82_691 [Ophiocordyceps australis]|uniref:Uncharacterized protein n=1 Tax=Ophiocordyceps australis TaxID=1399860 RepID=A0A2C5YL89_9HYPO|nr:hypothetical protein CDD82_691 [Ophiocordyceps australis]
MPPQPKQPKQPTHAHTPTHTLPKMPTFALGQLELVDMLEPFLRGPQRAVWEMPWQEVALRTNKTGDTLQQLMARVIVRPGYLNALLIASRGRLADPCANKCAHNGGHPFAECRTIDGFQGDACAAYAVHDSDNDSSSSSSESESSSDDEEDVPQPSRAVGTPSTPVATRTVVVLSSDEETSDSDDSDE